MYIQARSYVPWPMHVCMHAQNSSTTRCHGECMFDPQMWLQVSPLDSIADCVALLRHLVATKLDAPLWRQGRPALLVEGAAFSKPAPGGTAGTLVLDGYIREAGLTANQALSVPGAGDFSIGTICAAPEHVPLRGRTSGMVTEPSGGLPVLAAADADRCAPAPHACVSTAHLDAYAGSEVHTRQEGRKGVGRAGEEQCVWAGPCLACRRSAWGVRRRCHASACHVRTSQGRRGCALPVGTRSMHAGNS